MSLASLDKKEIHENLSAFCNLSGLRRRLLHILWSLLPDIGKLLATGDLDLLKIDQTSSICIIRSEKDILVQQI